jgi:hypothetical protein
MQQLVKFTWFDFLRMKIQNRTHIDYLHFKNFLYD